MRIAVSVGHTLTGADTGASEYLNESKCTREIGEYVELALKSQGHEVVFCRIDSASSVNSSLAYRVNKANSSNVDLFIEIHLNAGRGTGTETYVINGASPETRAYANSIGKSIALLGFPNRGVKTANFYVLRNTSAPAILIECCFVDNIADKNRYNAKNIGYAIAKGITGKTVEDTNSSNTSNSPDINIPDMPYNAVAISQCDVDTNDGTKGILYALGLFNWKWTEDGLSERPWGRYIEYLTNDKLKGGYIANGTIANITDGSAYNYYNVSDKNIKCYKDVACSEYLGCIYPNEKVCVAWVDENGIAYLRFDTATVEKGKIPLGKKGFCEATYLKKVVNNPDTSEPEPDEPTPDEPSKPTEEDKYNYKIIVDETQDETEMNKIVNDLKNKGYNNVTVESEYLGKYPIK